MPKRTRPYREALLEALADPTEAAHYLTAAIEDSPEMFRKALRNVAQARQVAKVARHAGVTRESLYRATSEIGNPTLDTLHSVLHAMDLKLSIEPDVIQGPVNTNPTAGAIIQPIEDTVAYFDDARTNLGSVGMPYNNIAASGIRPAPNGQHVIYFGTSPSWRVRETALFNTNANSTNPMPVESDPGNARPSGDIFREGVLNQQQVRDSEGMNAES